jgi:hypothetical protein
MAEAERRQEIQVGIPPSQSPPPAIAANVCLVNHLGQTFVLDFDSSIRYCLRRGPSNKRKP